MATRTVMLKHFIGNSLIFYDFELDLFLRDHKTGHIMAIAPSYNVDKGDRILCPNFPLIKGKLVGVKEDFMVWDTHANPDGTFEVEFYFSYDAKVIRRQVTEYVYIKCKKLKEGALVSRMLHRDKMPPEAFRHVVRIKKATYKLLSDVTVDDLKICGIFEEFMEEGDMGYNRKDVESAAMDYFRMLWRNRYRVHGYRYQDDPVVAVVLFRRSKNERYRKNAIPPQGKCKV